MRTLAIILLGLAIGASAADICVGPAATGSGSGADWSNQKAWAAGGWARGDTVWVADGTYTGSTLLNIAESGTNLVRIVKATEASHGPSTGWSSAYGDGVSDFSHSATTWEIRTGWWDIDGVSGSGTNSRGIKVSTATTNSLQAPIAIYYGFTPSNLVFRSIELSGRGVITTNSGPSSRGFYANISNASGWTFTNVYFHDVYIWASASTANDVMFDRCYFRNSGADWPDGYLGENYHGAGLTFAGTNVTIRYSVLENMLGTNNTTYVEPQAPVSRHVYVHGNVYWSTSASERVSQYGVLSMTSTDVLVDSVIANNTIVGLNGPCGISAGNFAGGTNVVVANNLWYDCTVNPIWSFVAPVTCITNGTSAVQFVNESSGDFRLAQNTTNGTATQFTVDPDGNEYGAGGIWSIGTYQYNIKKFRATTARVGTVSSP